jgi:hypothetical protein
VEDSNFLCDGEHAVKALQTILLFIEASMALADVRVLETTNQSTGVSDCQRISG